MEGAKEEMKIKIIISCIIIGVICFFIGVMYSKLTEDSGSGQLFTLNEDMIILNDRDKVIGTLPKGLMFYSIPDYWGDENFFKVYLRVYKNDLGPIKKIEQPSRYKKFQVVEFILRKK